MCGACSGGRSLGDLSRRLTRAKAKPRFAKDLNRLGRNAFVVSNAGDLWTLREKTGRTHVFTDADQLVQAAGRFIDSERHAYYAFAQLPLGLYGLLQARIPKKIAKKATVPMAVPISELPVVFSFLSGVAFSVRTGLSDCLSQYG